MTRKHRPDHPGHIYLANEDPRPDSRERLCYAIMLFAAGIGTGLWIATCEVEAYADRCGPTCRYSPAVAERVREAWSAVVEAADQEDQEPLLLAAVASWESAFRPVRGGLRHQMWGVGQVACSIWLASLQERHAASLACDDLLDVRWGLAASALALRHFVEAAEGRVAVGLCAYAHGRKALFWPGCQYARDVLEVRRMLGRDLGDLVGGEA